MYIHLAIRHEIRDITLFHLLNRKPFRQNWWKQKRNQSTFYLSCTHSSNSITHLCWILQEYTTFGESSDMYPLTFLKSLINITFYYLFFLLFSGLFFKYIKISAIMVENRSSLLSLSTCLFIYKQRKLISIDGIHYNLVL